MTQDQFQQRLSGLTDADMHGATLGGHPVTADVLKAPWSSWFGSRNPIRLQSADPDSGKYLVISGDPTAPSKVVDPTTGRALVIDLGPNADRHTTPTSPASLIHKSAFNPVGDTLGDLGEPAGGFEGSLPPEEHGAGNPNEGKREHAPGWEGEDWEPPRIKEPDTRKA